MLGICICYFTVSIVMRTKDDFRFVIPYVEFAKQTKGARPLVLDTSAIVDGRIADLCEGRVFDALKRSIGNCEDAGTESDSAFPVLCEQTLLTQR